MIQRFREQGARQSPLSCGRAICLCQTPPPPYMQHGPDSEQEEDEGMKKKNGQDSVREEDQIYTNHFIWYDHI